MIISWLFFAKSWKRSKFLKNWKGYLSTKNNYIYQKGYEKITEDKDIIRLENIFDKKKNIYIDDVHFDKYGSELIGMNLKKYLLSEWWSTGY